MTGECGVPYGPLTSDYLRCGKPPGHKGIHGPVYEWRVCPTCGYQDLGGRSTPDCKQTGTVSPTRHFDFVRDLFPTEPRAESTPDIAEQPRANWIGAPEFYELNQACRTITEAFGFNVYLVGSALTTREHRDVDVRCILPDDEYAELFPGIGTNTSLDARWSLLCSALSLWLSKHSGLKIDFQIQQMTDANEKFSGHRHALGIFLERKA